MVPAHGSEGGYRSVLGHKVARRLVASDLVSTLGDFLGMGALVLVAYERTGTVLGPAALFASQAVAGLLTATVASGVVARLPRRRAMVTGQLLGAALLVLLVFSSTYLEVLLVVTALGFVRAVTATQRSSIFGTDVPDEVRGRAMALSSVNYQASQVVGYVAGAGLASLVGATSALLVDAATFIAGAVVLAGLTVGPTPIEQDRKPRARDGLDALRTTRGVRVLLPMLVVTLAGGAVPEALAGALTTGEQARWTGVLMAASPAGSAIGALMLGRRGHLEDPVIMVRIQHVGAAMFAVAAATLWLGLPWWTTAVAFVGSGVGASWLSGAQARFAQLLPRERLAQVAATMVAAVILLEGAGALALATVADVTNPSLALGLLALGTAASTRMAVRHAGENGAEPAVAGSVPAGQ